MKKAIVLLLSAIFVALTFCSCGPVPSDLEFSDNGLTLTLDTTFKQDESENWSMYYWSQNRDIHIYVLKEYFSPLRTMDEPVFDFEDYVDYNVEFYEVDPESVVYEGKNAYFEYDTVLEREESGRKINYNSLVAMYQGPDAFWTAEFCCRKVDYAQYGGMLKKFAMSAEFYNYTAPPMTFSKRGFQITLTDEFLEDVNDDSCFASYYSEEFGVYVGKNSKTGEYENITLEEYIESCVGEFEAINKYKDLTYVEFWWEGSYGMYVSKLYAFERDDAFWNVEIIVDYDDYERLEDKMNEFAESVKLK